MIINYYKKMSLDFFIILDKDNVTFVDATDDVDGKVSQMLTSAAIITDYNLNKIIDEGDVMKKQPVIVEELVHELEGNIETFEKTQEEQQLQSITKTPALIEQPKEQPPTGKIIVQEVNDSDAFRNALLKWQEAINASHDQIKHADDVVVSLNNHINSKL